MRCEKLGLRDRNAPTKRPLKHSVHRAIPYFPFPSDPLLLPPHRPPLGSLFGDLSMSMLRRYAEAGGGRAGEGEREGPPLCQLGKVLRGRMEERDHTTPSWVEARERKVLFGYWMRARYSMGPKTAAGRKKRPVTWSGC